MYVNEFGFLLRVIFLIECIIFVELRLIIVFDSDIKIFILNNCFCLR